MMPARGRNAWGATWAVVVALQLSMPAWPGSDEQLGSARSLFWLVVVAASLCVVGSLSLLVRAWRDDTAEAGLIATWFHAVSLLPLVHGITVPGVLYDENPATVTAVLWALPAASLAAAPLLLPRRWRTRALKRWRRWAGANVALHAALAFLLLAKPDGAPRWGMGEPPAIALSLAALAFAIALSARSLRLYRISHQRATMGVSLSFAFVAAANLVFVNGSPMNMGFWLAHLLDIIGVLVGTVLGLVAYRRGQIDRLVLRPLTLRDPLDALELGLEPVVRAFVADLGRKDPVTQEHVKRTAEIAMLVAGELGCSSAELRLAGIGGLLHDVGKLRVSDAVLNKPGRLSREEYAHMQEHAVAGEAMVRASRVLAPIAPIVRHHHERIDGDGYPDRLAGEAIPRLARIVSVCDSFDAMAHNRQYRDGMGDRKAMAILREHAGSQWDAEVVAALCRLVEGGAVPSAPTVLGGVGSMSCVSCTHDLPALALYG